MLEKEQPCIKREPGKGDKKVVRLAGGICETKKSIMSRFCLHSRLSVYYRVYTVKIMKIPKQDKPQNDITT